MALSAPLRSALRLSFAVAVAHGFAALTGLADITYASLAVLSVSVSSYGETLELGRQRLIGTLVGGVILVVAYPALRGLPLAAGLPLALLLTRVVAGGLRLTVGYSVGCMVVVMGWVVHEHQITSWIPLRLGWTSFGVLVALLSLRLFWPSLARRQQQQGLVALIGQIQQGFQEHREHRKVPMAPLRATLLAVRNQRSSALMELGGAGRQHPLLRLWQSFDAVLEDQILILGEAQRLPSHPLNDPAFAELNRQLVMRLAAVVQRLQLWQELLQKQMLAPPPQPPWEPVDQLAFVDGPVLERMPQASRSQLAARLMLLNRLEQGLRSAELQWREATERGRDG